VLTNLGTLEPGLSGRARVLGVRFLIGDSNADHYENPDQRMSRGQFTELRPEESSEEAAVFRLRI
jgi:hypothetical protein